ncbi:MAG TPA: DUF1592 domain-containing protein [Steroidobacteraceae bacterium]|nr:DUF1592 domain-containing protein [Steroidobacteraceae bacterium]
MLGLQRAPWARVTFLVSGLLLSTAAFAANEPSSVTAYRKTVLPMLEDHCFECHGDGYDKGKVAFDQLETNDDILDKSLWMRVLVNTRSGLMPADNKPRLSAAEQRKLEDWIKYDVFGIDPKNPDPGRVTVRRLNRVEYRNTIRDLVGVDFKTEEEFPADDTGFGFDNIGDVLTMSPMLMEKYVAAAQVIAADAVPTAPREPGRQVVWGSTFTGEKAVLKKNRLRLSFADTANAAQKVRVEKAGTYKVTFDVDVRGDFVFNEGRARAVLKVDGQEVRAQEFPYYNEKTFTFDSTHKWQPGEHTFTVELTPTAPGSEKGKPTELIVNKVTAEGPLEKDLWVETKNYSRFFPKAVPKGRAERHAYAREILGNFASLAYRRPVTDDSADRLALLAEYTYTQKGKNFEQGVQHAMAAVLASPRFLFRLEEPVDEAGRYALIDEYSLASRLSYFLWSTMPDAELTSLAARHQLRNNLKAQVTRMLADDKAKALSVNFTGQWLESRDIDGISANAREILIRDAGEEATLNKLRAAWERGDETEARKFAKQIDALVKSRGDWDLDGDLRTAMRRETSMYFEHVVKQDRPVTELITSDYAFVNEKLAQLYGIPGVEGPELRLVKLPAGSPRGGVLTQASTLIVTSNPDRTSPVKRGLFVLANFLGTPPPPPPANVPALEASENHVEGHEPTLRESLAIHRENPACSSCHNRMDPIGLAFENFNALGQWRDTERRQPILAPGKLITGETFNSVNELKTILATGHRRDFYRTLTDKLMTYALGRGTEYYDVETIDGIVRNMESADGKFSTLLMGVIDSTPFQKMRTEATVTASN